MLVSVKMESWQSTIKRVRKSKKSRLLSAKMTMRPLLAHWIWCWTNWTTRESVFGNRSRAPVIPRITCEAGDFALQTVSMKTFSTTKRNHPYLLTCNWLWLPTPRFQRRRRFWKNSTSWAFPELQFYYPLAAFSSGTGANFSQ